MQNYLLIIEYDGADFHGWQKQPGCRTVQRELEKAAAKLFGGTVKVTGASRTDAGVHARGQAASIIARKKLEPDRVVPGMNALLPADISVVTAEKMPAGFDARRSAKYKIYTYRVWNRPYRSVWAQKTSWHFKSPISAGKARKSAKAFAGRHDFGAFAAAGGAREDKTVKLEPIRIKSEGGMLVFTFRARSFVYRMIRNIMGALIEAGRGKLKTERIAEALKTGKKNFNATTAPAKGLVLERVVYEK